MSELEEVRHLISIATFPGVKQALQNYEQTLITEGMEVCEPAAEPAVAAAPIAPSTSTPTATPTTTSAASTSSQPKVTSLPPPPAPVFGGRDQIYIPITDFAWDQGGYNSDTVTVYVELPDVGTVKDQVHCSFTTTSFDLIISNLNGKNYRLIKDNLDKDIVPGNSKCIVKKNRILLKLQKVKGEYSYEHWANLTAKKPRDSSSGDKKKDPSASIMDMMKDMYNEGDDNMKKIIGEAMMKSRNGEKSDMPPL